MDEPNRNDDQVDKKCISETVVDNVKKRGICESVENVNENNDVEEVVVKSTAITCESEDSLAKTPESPENLEISQIESCKIGTCARGNCSDVFKPSSLVRCSDIFLIPKTTGPRPSCLPGVSGINQTNIESKYETEGDSPPEAKISLKDDADDGTMGRAYNDLNQLEDHDILNDTPDEFKCLMKKNDGKNEVNSESSWDKVNERLERISDVKKEVSRNKKKNFLCFSCLSKNDSKTGSLVIPDDKFVQAATLQNDAKPIKRSSIESSQRALMESKNASVEKQPSVDIEVNNESPSKDDEIKPGSTVMFNTEGTTIEPSLSDNESSSIPGALTGNEWQTIQGASVENKSQSIEGASIEKDDTFMEKQESELSPSMEEFCRIATCNTGKDNNNNDPNEPKSEIKRKSIWENIIDPNRNRSPRDSEGGDSVQGQVTSYRSRSILNLMDTEDERFRLLRPDSAAPASTTEKNTTAKDPKLPGPSVSYQDVGKVQEDKKKESLPEETEPEISKKPENSDPSKKE